MKIQKTKIKEPTEQSATTHHLPTKKGGRGGAQKMSVQSVYIDGRGRLVYR